MRCVLLKIDNNKFNLMHMLVVPTNKRTATVTGFHRDGLSPPR